MFNNKNILPADSYNKSSFEQFWTLLELSDDKILGIAWNEKNMDEIKRQLTKLDFKLKHSKSPNLIGFSFRSISGDIIDGGIAFAENKIHCCFHFVFKKADNLIDWLEKKYGKSLNLRNETLKEYRYDWTDSDILLEAEMSKLSKFVSLGLQKWADYTKLARGEINHDEFFERHENKVE